MNLSNLDSGSFLLLVGVIAIGWAAFYYTIKGGILAAKEEPGAGKSANDRASWNYEQLALQKQYERGEITTEAFRKNLSG